MNSKCIHVKITIVGPEKVGKTTLCHRFVNNIFEADYKPTAGAQYFSRSIEKYNLQIWDTTGSSRYALMLPLYVRDTVVLIVMYDVSDRQSLTDTIKIYNGIKESLPEKCCHILLANKCDIIQRKVSFEEGYSISRANGLIYVETSTKCDDVRDLFANIVKLAL